MAKILNLIGTISLLFFYCGFDTLKPHELKQPIVVITFDDGHKSIYEIAFPVMASMDSSWSATHFLPVTYIGKKGNVTLAQLKKMEKAGWETGGHGYTHANLSSLPPDSIEFQIQASYMFLKNNGLSHQSYAYAWGNYNISILDIAEKYFDNIRTAHDFLYLDGINRKELGYFAVKKTHSASDIIARVEQARFNHAPLVIIGFHVILKQNAPPLPVYWCRIGTFREFLEYLADNNLRVMNMGAAMELLIN